MNPELIQQVAIGAMVASIMLQVGLDANSERLEAAWKSRRAVVAALSINFVAAPIIAVVICRAFALDTEASAALLLVACAPGGPIGSLFAAISGGDMVFAGALVFLLTVLSAVLTPLLLLFTSNTFGIELSAAGQSLPGDIFWRILEQIGAFQLLPMAAGLVISRFFPQAAGRISRVAEILGKALLGAITIGLIVTQSHLIAQVPPRVVVADLIFLLLAASSARMLQIAERSRVISVASCTATRNLGLALLISHAMFGSRATIYVMFFGLLMMIFGALQLVRFLIPQRALANN